MVMLKMVVDVMCDLDMMTLTSGMTFIHSGLCHQVGNVLLQVVNPVAHVINSADDVLRHVLELILHLGQKVLHKCCEILNVLRIGRISDVICALHFCCVFCFFSKNSPH